MDFNSVLESPYEMNWDDYKRDFMIRGYIAFGLTDYRAVIRPSVLTNDVSLMSLRPRWSKVVEGRLRLFHERPSWRMFGLLLKAAFLSGIEDTRSSYCLT
jgi:hypothetical protein